MHLCSVFLEAFIFGEYIRVKDQFRISTIGQWETKLYPRVQSKNLILSLISASYFESCQKQNCPESCGETEHSHLNNKIDQPPISSPAIILIFQFLKHFLGHAVQSRKTVVHLKVVKSSSCLKCGKTFQLNSLFYSLAKSWCLKQAFHCKNNYLKQSGWKYFLDSGSNKM